MDRIKSARPSPAIIVAVLALVAALAGTAVAEQATTSAKKPVTKKKARTIAKKQANKQIDNRLPLIPHTETFQVPNSTTVDETVECDENEQVISGGYEWDNFADEIFVITQLDQRSDNNGWRAGGINASGATQPFTVWVNCIPTG
jgi:hypothetical protein